MIRHSSIPKSTLQLHRPLLFAAALAGSLAIPSIAEARPSYCGNEGQRPCNFWEALPSCDGGLEENFLDNVCQAPTPWFPPPLPPPSGPVCGAENLRPCSFWEQVPSCNEGLVEDFLDNRCELPRVPAARPSECGNPGQTPCALITGVLPSCVAGYKESFANPNTCVALQAGEWSPFFAGLEAMNDQFVGLGELAKDACRSEMSTLITNGGQFQFANDASDMGGLGLSLQAVPGDQQCLAYVGAGFACEVPTMIEMFALPFGHDIFHELESRFNEVYGSAPCANVASETERASCALGMMLFESVLPGSASTTECFVAAAQNPALWTSLTGEVSLSSDTCMNIGTALFDLAMLAIESKSALSKGANKNTAADDWFKNRRNTKYANSSTKNQLEANNKLNRLPAMDSVMAALEAAGAADQVAGILAGIPECATEDPDASAIWSGSTFYQVGGAETEGALMRSTYASDGYFSVINQEIAWHWDTAFEHVFAAEGGHVYAIGPDGILRHYQHDANGDWYDWYGDEIGWGWGAMERVFAGRFGQIFAIDGDGKLYLYEHDSNFSWTFEAQIGTGWDVPAVFSGGADVVYAIVDGGDLQYFEIDDVSNTWLVTNKQIGQGWDAFATAGSTGNGELIGVTNDGELLFYRHDIAGRWVDGSGGLIGWGWGTFGDDGLIPAAG